MATILKGKPVSILIDQNTKEIIGDNSDATLVTIRVADNKDDIAYENNISKKASALNISHRKIVLADNVSQQQYLDVLQQSNLDDTIDGILLLNQPFEKESSLLINPNKDIDSCNPINLSSSFLNSDGFNACTAQAVMEMLHYYNIQIASKNVCIVGRSKTVGKPLSMMLLNENATVTICHSHTVNLKDICKKSDIIIACLGKAEYLDQEYFSAGQTVIDVGINYSEVKQKIVGDVLFEEVSNIVSNISPVPLGVGSITTSVLFNHLALAYQRSKR
ncbi:MAG: bifunctional 5,10-methylenetetrahydrofolate dehydrogenase/5,10-methenyltetrahydrofolate cyclohydrolase [Erysipelotrichaceae bacterium]